MRRIKKISCLFLLLFFLNGCSMKKEEIIWENLQTESEENIHTESMMMQSETQEQELICIDISGAVNVPGVYLMEPGSRVYQLVEMAGGLGELADRNSVNLAAVLKDGEKVRIYTVEEAQSLLAMEEQSGKINLNTADIQSLCTLSGIGQSRAQDIISYREAHGSFQNIEDIMNVNGIKETTFQKIKDKIVVE